MSLRYVCWVFFFFYLGFNVTGCGDRNATHIDDMEENDEIDLDQDVTKRPRPQDSIFLDFEKNWTKFITQAEVLRRPVRTPKQPENWEPIIISDCITSPDFGGVVPQVDISWSEQPTEKPVRFDLSLHYQGFERNYYTIFYPEATQQRFNLPMNSQFVNDTAAILLTGPPIFPKVVNFQEKLIEGNQQQQQTKSYGDVKNYTLRISDLGSGLSYRIRKCTFDREVWTPTQEYIFTTPICPLDFD